MLYSLMLGMFALGTDLFVMAGVLPRIAADLGVDLARAGWLVSAFAIVYGLAAPLLMAAITATSIGRDGRTRWWRACPRACAGHWREWWRSDDAPGRWRGPHGAVAAG